MARAELTATQITRDGVLDSGTAGVADGHKFVNTGRCFIEVANSDSGAARTITFVTPKTLVSLALADLAVEIPASSSRLIGPFPGDIFNQQSGADEGMVYVNYEAGQHTKFTVKVYEL